MDKKQRKTKLVRISEKNHRKVKAKSIIDDLTMSKVMDNILNQHVWPDDVVNFIKKIKK
jgi:hypothetical protein